MALTKVHYRMIDGAYFNVLDFGADTLDSVGASALDTKPSFDGLITLD